MTRLLGIIWTVTMVFFTANSVEASCQKFYPFLTSMPSPPTSTRLNLELFDQLYSTSLAKLANEIECPVEMLNKDDVVCSSAYDLGDGTLIFSGYSRENFTGDLDELAIDLDVHGVKAKLAPIPTNNGMLNMGYRDPNIGGEVVLTIWMPLELEKQYSDVAPLFPLLLRAFEADVCTSD